MIAGADDLPAELLAAFLDYEDALRTDDLARLDGAFAAGEHTLRGDAAGVLVGHDRISAFRGGRGGIAPRRIVQIEARRITDDAILVVSVSRFDSGGDGLQTQLWVRQPDRWRISVAHVTSRPLAFDPSIWRELGDPLLAGAGAGQLLGRTVAVKDLFDLAGHRVGAGNPSWLAESTPATTTAPAVRALLGAGASVRGIARTDEFAYSIAGQNAHYGTPPNARVPGAVPGGSSSGPTTAVALGQVDIGLGTDTAGSVRVPASYQGLWGLRTTHGSVDRGGLLPLAPSFDSIGWLTRDSATLRAALVASLGETTTPIGSLVVAPGSLGGVDTDTRAVFEARIASLTTETIDLPSPDDLFSAFRTVQQSEAWAAHGAWVEAHPGALSPDIAARFALAAAVDSATANRARVTVSELRARIRRALGDRVLLVPTAPGPAPDRTADRDTIEAIRASTLRLTAIAGIAGLPALSVPALEVGGKPVGISLVGPVGSDLALVDLAASLFGVGSSGSATESKP